MRRSPMRRTAKARVRRDTGPSASVRDLVIQRARYLCERCGCGADGSLQIHHRRPRRMGGTRDPAINLPPNLLLLCLACHANVESHRFAAYDDGFLVPMGSSPAAVAVNIFGRGRQYLDNEGGYRPEPLP